MRRKGKSYLVNPLVLAGGAVLGYASVKGIQALLGLRPGADVDFFHELSDALRHPACR